MKSGLIRRAVSVVAVCGMAVSAWAQESYTKGTVLILDTAALSKMMPDAKDQAMVKALEMIPARVKELPGEIPDMPPEAAGVINAAMSCIGKPMRLTVSYDGDLPSGGLFGYGIAVSFLVGDEGVAGEVHKTVSGLLAQSGQRIKTSGTRWKGMSDIQAGVGVVSFGPRQSKDGWRYEVVFGTMNDADGAADVLPKMEGGIEPLVRARMDFAGLTPLRDIANQMGAGGEMVTEVVKSLEGMGLVGTKAMKINYVAGVTKDECVSYSTWEGAGRFAKSLHMSQTPLAEADFAAVPADACDVYMARMGEDGFGYLLGSLEQFGPMVGEALEEFKSHTGVDIKADVLDSLGGTGILYMSDSTGGGGILSATAMLSFKDRAKASTAMKKLSDAANDLAKDLPLPGQYVNIGSWKDGDTEVLTLRFPGVPVPLELSMAMTKSWLILGPTPQGVLAAARQASGKGDGGLMANASFKSRFPAGKKVLSVGFSDTPRTMKDGYAVVTLVGSAVANMVRSPHGAEREPGLTVPMYNDLARGVKAKVSFSYWNGEDLVNETHSDRSGLVGVAGALATLQKIAPVIAIPAAMAGGFAQGLEGLGAVSIPDRSGRFIAGAALRAFPMGTLGMEELAVLAAPPAVMALPMELKGTK